jgi:hypothetical protein
MRAGLLVALLLMADCQPLRTAEYEQQPSPRPTGNVVLDVGRRYAVVSAGTGVITREQPSPAARAVATHGFAAVVATTGESNGADGAVWRRVQNGGWAPRQALIVFGEVGEAVALAIELRVFAPRDLRNTIQARDAPPRPTVAPSGATPGGASPSGTNTGDATPAARAAPTVAARPPTARPSTPPASTPPTGTGGLAEPFYGVVVRPSTRLYQTAGGQLSERAPLQPGAAVAILDQAIGSDGQPWLKLENNLWLAADRVAVHASPSEAAAVAYEVTMNALAPGVEVHPDLAPALWVLQREAELRYLAETIRDARVPIRVEKLPDAAPLAAYSFSDRTITFAERALVLDTHALAAYLAHEATHAWEHTRGLVLQPGAPCFEAELRAFRNQARLWELFYGPNGKPQPSGDAERELNQIGQLLKEEPQQLKLRLVDLYGDQCGYHGPRPNLPAATPPAGSPGATPGAKPVTTPAATPAATPPPKPAAPAKSATR